jgi:superfamily II helicase
VSVAITDKVYLADHRRIASQLDASVPRRAFAGATLDVLYGADAEGLAALDDATRDRLLAFADDFLRGCDEADLYGGVPERRFLSCLLDRRAAGLDPDRIVDSMEADYSLTAYPGDVRSFLDGAIRTLEAAAAVADVDGAADERRRIEDRRRELL